jgi:hypothetical protein
MCRTKSVNKEDGEGLIETHKHYYILYGKQSSANDQGKAQDPEVLYLIRHKSVV